MLRKAVAVLLALLFLGEGLAPIAAAAGDGAAERAARVAANSLNLRGGPGTGYAVVRSLPRDTRVTIVAVQGDWSQLRLEDGTTGWAASKYLEAAPADTDGEAVPVEGEPDAWPGEAGTGDARSGGGSTQLPAADRAAGGGISLRGVAKWGCLAGALVAGGLAFSAHSSGNDAYDEYQQLYGAGSFEAAEGKYNDALDQDDKAQTFLIIGGALVGLFVVQQFLLGGKDEAPRSALEWAPSPGALTWSVLDGEIRLALVRIRL
jgi:hypothetical protein